MMSEISKIVSVPGELPEFNKVNTEGGFILFLSWNVSK
jgi:hypothetical protein